MPGKHLGLWSGVGLVIANMVGAGVFLSAGFMAQDLGPGQILLAWVVGAALALCGSVAYAEVARLVPRSGGEYRYLSTLLHPSLGYLAGWASLLVGFSAPVAIDALAAGDFAHQLFGVPPTWTAALLIAALCAVHASGLSTSARGQNLLIAVKVLLLIFFAGAGLAKGATSWPTWTPPHLSDGFPTGAFVTSLFFIAFAFSGWNAAIYASEEFEQPTKTVPKAMMIGCAGVAVLYLLINYVFVANLDPLMASVVFKYDDEGSAKVTLGHAVMEKLLGSGAANVMSGIILLAFISAISAMTLVGPRVYAAMAKDGFLPKALAANEGHPPRISVLLQSGLAIVLVFTHKLPAVLGNVGAILTLFAALTMAGLFRAALSNVTAEKPRVIALAAAFIYAGSTVFMLYTAIGRWLHPPFGEAHPEFLIWIAVVSVVALVAWGITKAIAPASKGVPDKLSAAPAPARLGRYQLVELLGQGGMGEVWIAKISGERGFEKACLVKTVLPQLAKDRSFLERFEHEAKVLTLLQHSNIAQVYDMGEAEGRLYMALEYITGVDVSQLAAAMRHDSLLLPVPVALFIGWQAAEGLGYAHRKMSLDGTALDLVHRDVTPQNVMVSFEGEVKVIDFGIARSSAREKSTQTATVMGKLGYMSPEQALAQPLDARTDQYALAVVVWELLTGVAYIQEGTTPAQVMQAMAYPKPRSLMGRRADVDTQLDAALNKALAVKREDRYPTTDDFARALLMQLSRLGGPPPKAQVGQFVRTRCATQFQTSQRLLSKVSSFARAAVPEPAMPQKTMLQPPPGVETIVVPGLDVVTGEISAPLPKLQRSKAPLIGLAVGVAVLGAGAFAYWKMNQTPQVVPVAKQNVAVALDAGEQPDAAVVAAKIEEPPKLVEVKKTAELFIENGETYAKAGGDEGLKPGQVLSVVGPMTEHDLYPALGQATVKQVFSNLTVVSLDDAAAAAGGPKLLALTVAKAHEEHVFKATVSVVNNSNGRVVKVENDSSFGWTRCVFSIAGKQSFALATLPSKASHGVGPSQFKPDPHAPVLNDAIEIRCAEGSARLPLR